MSSVLLENTRKLNKILQASGIKCAMFSNVTEMLSQILDCNVFIVSIKGRIIGISLRKKNSTQPFIETEPNEFHFSNKYSQKLLECEDTQINLIQDMDNKISITVVPIHSGTDRLGTLIFELFGTEMTTEDVILAEYGATLTGMEVMRSKTAKLEEKARKKAVVQLAMGTLSYSEIEAVESIFKELDGIEGLLIASKIADQAGITRSVIVNALRKLESAGIIESRSLGMKGTHIKILNEELLAELESTK